LKYFTHWISNLMLVIMLCLVLENSIWNYYLFIGDNSLVTTYAFSEDVVYLEYNTEFYAIPSENAVYWEEYDMAFFHQRDAGSAGILYSFFCLDLGVQVGYMMWGLVPYIFIYELEQIGEIY